MSMIQSGQERWTIGPLGEKLTLAALPPRGQTRWVVRRKAEVIAAVDGGLLTFDEACDRYYITADEFASWQRSIERAGLSGLRATPAPSYKTPRNRALFM